MPEISFISGISSNSHLNKRLLMIFQNCPKCAASTWAYKCLFVCLSRCLKQCQVSVPLNMSANMFKHFKHKHVHNASKIAQNHVMPNMTENIKIDSTNKCQIECSIKCRENFQIQDVIKNDDILLCVCMSINVFNVMQ